MTLPGIAQLTYPPREVRLGCGHVVLFVPPVPLAGEELTCGICGDPTEVVDSPRRWKP